jgi:hypothetical protein
MYEIRKALVIGNATYDAPMTLKNPVNDARFLAQALGDLRFDIDLRENLDREGLIAAISEFAKSLEGAEAGVFYFAGHGVQVDGDNFLLPIGCQPTNKIELESGAIKLPTLLDALGNAVPTTIFFLDCCRNNPLPRWLNKTRGPAPAGLVAPIVPRGSFVAFATMSDAVAEEGAGRNSPFSETLGELIKAEDKSISDVMTDVRRKVRELTNGKQVPMDWSMLDSPYAFNRKSAALTMRNPTPEEREEEFWDLVKDSNSASLLTSFMREFPRSNRFLKATDKLNLLNYRERWNKIWKTCGYAFFTLIALGISWFLIEYYVRFTYLENTDLEAGDISLPTGEFGEKSNYGHFGCKLKCIFTSDCIAYTYGTNKKCYIKNDYIIKQYSKYTQSGYIGRSAFTGFRKREPLPNPFESLDYARIHSGKIIDASGQPLTSEINSVSDLQFGLTIDDLKKTARVNRESFEKYRNPSTICQSLCITIDKCKGFNYSMFQKRCKLFSEKMNEVTLIYDEKKHEQCDTSNFGNECRFEPFFFGSTFGVKSEPKKK